MSGKFYIKLEGSEDNKQRVTDRGSIGFGEVTQTVCGEMDLLHTDKWLYLSGENAKEDYYDRTWTMEGVIVEFNMDLLNILYGVE